jgi:hypothetical protein
MISARECSELTVSASLDFPGSAATVHSRKVMNVYRLAVVCLLKTADYFTGLGSTVSLCALNASEAFDKVNP